MPQFEQRRFAKGAVIFREGDRGSCMYDILQGKVGIYADHGKTSEKRLTALGVHDFFGEMGLMDAMPRSATALAELDTVVRVVGPEGLGAWFRESPEKVLEILRHLSARTRELTEDYRQVCKTVAELQEAEKRGAARSGSLTERVNRFAGFWRRSMQHGQ